MHEAVSVTKPAQNLYLIVYIILWLNYFEFLEQKHEYCIRRLCGEQSIQIWPFEDTFDYESVRQRLLKYGLLIDTNYMLRLSVENCEISLFRDGRSIIRGAPSTGRAQSLYANYIGY